MELEDRFVARETDVERLTPEIQSLNEQITLLFCQDTQQQCLLDAPAVEIAFLYLELAEV